MGSPKKQFEKRKKNPEGKKTDRQVFVKKN